VKSPATDVGIGEQRRDFARFHVALKFAEALYLRLRMKVVQAYDTGDDRSERLGNLWVLHIGEMLDTANAQAMNIGVKSIANLASRAVKGDQGFAVRDLQVREAL